MRPRKSNVPRKERWYVVVDEQDQSVCLVRTSGDADAAKKKYFQMCGLEEDEDLDDAMKNHEGMEVTPLERFTDSSLNFHELWRG